MILDKTQAETLASSIRAMSAVGGRGYEIRFTTNLITVDFRGRVRVFGKFDDENYEDMDAFCAAYEIL